MYTNTQSKPLFERAAPASFARMNASAKLANLLNSVVVGGLFGALLTATPAFAEGSFQAGINQPFVETLATVGARDLLVDITSSGEVINISACGAAQANSLRYIIESPTGAIVADYTTGVANVVNGKISCTDPMTGVLTTAYKYTTTQNGRFKVRLVNVTAANFARFDVTVTSSTAVNPDPSGATGIVGRVSALVWSYATGSFALASATNANYYTLAPGGFPGTNYVWQLDLNQLAGNAYSITSNNLGVAAPRSGFSTPKAGNSSTPLYQVYLNYPTIAGPVPTSAPAVTGFRFVDNAGQDAGISPGGTAGIQDSGFFQFTTNTTVATYAIKIDANANGIFGDAGDVTLSGNAANGFNSIAWNGTNNAGVALPVARYQARAEIRLGEFHFIGDDIETSGGGLNNGLTINQALSQTTTLPTRVYWDDVTILGAAVGRTSNTPAGTLSGIHTWGDFSGVSFGDSAFVDTYVFGATTQASLFLAITATDTLLTGANGAVTITPASVPGDALALSVTDADLNSLATIVETMLVSVRNDITGEIEVVTLTETGVNTGVFTGNLATTFGLAAGANSSGTMNSKGGDTITVTYDDALSSTGAAVVRTAQDVVSAVTGTDATVTITPTSFPGDTLALSVKDADLNTLPSTVETIVVTVRNDTTGEIETITLTETGPNTGIFEGSLPTTYGATLGAENSGTINSKDADRITVYYTDALSSTGASANLSASDVVGTPKANLQITKDDGVTTVSSGEIVTYKMVVTNNGPDSITGAVVTDTPGPGLTCPSSNEVAVTGADGVITNFTIADLLGGGITLGKLANGESALLVYSCQVN